MTYPWILSCTHHFAAQFDKLGTSDDGKRNVRVHRVVDLLDGLIVGWERVNLYAVRLQFFIDFSLNIEFLVRINNWKIIIFSELTLNFCNSVLEMVSALAMMGTILTLVSS